jgi:hypothetical protein
VARLGEQEDPRPVEADPVVSNVGHGEAKEGLHGGHVDQVERASGGGEDQVLGLAALHFGQGTGPQGEGISGRGAGEGGHVVDFDSAGSPRNHCGRALGAELAEGGGGGEFCGRGWAGEVRGVPFGGADRE